MSCKQGSLLPCFSVLCFLLVILLFKVTPRLSAEVPSSVPKCKKAVTFLMEETLVLDGLCSGMSYGAVCSELSGNESTV